MLKVRCMEVRAPSLEISFDVPDLGLKICRRITPLSVASSETCMKNRTLQADILSSRTEIIPAPVKYTIVISNVLIQIYRRLLNLASGCGTFRVKKVRHP